MSAASRFPLLPYLFACLLGLFALGGYDADSFSKARHACLQFAHRASLNFCNHGVKLDLPLTFSMPHKGHQDRDIAPHPRQDRSTKMPPCALRALDYVSHRPPNNKPFNPEHLSPTQRKKASAVRLRRSHLVLAVGAACRCSCSNIG